MLPPDSLRQNLFQKQRIKIRSSNHENNSQNDDLINQIQQFSFNDQNRIAANNSKMIRNQSKQKRHESKLSKLSSDRWLQKNKNEGGSIMLSDLVKKLEKISYSVLQSEYGSSFVQNSSHFQWIKQLKYEDSTDKLLQSYTSILLTMIQVEQQQRFNSQPKFKLVTLEKAQRTKLKLIMSSSQQAEVNLLKNKGMETYVNKIEEECQKHKREHVRIKERNRVLENQLLKLALEFKQKRELYVTQITRLTEILHSSFMEVGKMFVKYPDQNSDIYPPGLYQKYENKNAYIPPKPQPPIYTRKNVKSASPIRKFDNYYPKDQQRLLPDFIKQPVKTSSQQQNYLKSESVMKRNAQNFRNENRTNRHFDAVSQPGKQQFGRVEHKPTTFMSSTVNFNTPKDTF